MSADLSTLDPTAPLATQETLEQRLTRKFEGFRARLAALERTRLPTGAGPGMPESPALPGTRWMDTTGRRLYVYSDERGWYSVDAARAEAFDASTVTTTSTTNVDLGGPSLTMFVPTPGIIGIQVDAELYGIQDGLNETNAQVGIEHPDGTKQLVLMTQQQIGFNVWQRVLSVSGRDAITVAGSPYPNGGFMVVQVGEPGVYTWKLLYLAQAESGDPQAVSFRNRGIWAVAL